MKRSWFTAATAALALVIGTAGAATPASAAPPTSPWNGSAGADVVSLSLSTLGITLTELGIATSDTAAGTTLSPRSTSTSANLSADVLGLGLGAVQNTKTAPPTTAPSGLNLLAANALVFDLGALTSTNQATWTVDTACVTGGDLATADTQLAGLNVLAGTVQLGVSSVHSSTRLAQNAGLNYGVQSTATGSISGLSLLSGQIGISVAGSPVLTATSTGTTNSISYTPAPVTVTWPGNTAALVPGVALPITIGTTQVSITMNQPPTTGATASFDFLSIEIDSLLGTDVSLGVLPLSVAASAPAGGIDCPPPAPVITAPTAGATTSPTPTIAGTAEPNASVQVLIDGVSAGTTNADGSGNWSLPITTPLPGGAHTATATQTVAGQLSPTSTPVPFTVDATAPPAPVILTPVTGQVLNDNTPAITGTAEAGSTVTVIIDGVAAGSATADGSGNWSFTPAAPLTDGAHTVVATATDAVGNTSPNSNTVTFTIDTVAPVAPVITSPPNDSTLDDTTPAFTGTAEANSTVTVYIDGASAGTTTANGSGAWTFTPSAPLAEGAHTAVATSTDAAGNTSPNSNTVAFTIDTLAPEPPVITDPSDGDVLADPTPDIVGTAEAGSTVTVFIDGVEAGLTPADGSGNWTFTPTSPLGDGEHTVFATATDALGHDSAASNEVTFTIDTVDPAAPVITEPGDGDVVNDNTPDIVGTAEANTTVTVYIDGVEAGTTPADGSGNWTFTPTTPLAEGSHTVVATATDAAGNTSPDSDEVTFTVDTVAPAAPIITDPVNGDVLADDTPTIVGTAEADSTVSVFIDGSLSGTTTANGSGNWSFTPAPLDEGAHTVVATARDAAGNISPDSNTVSFTIDTVDPAAPVITDPSNGDVVADSTPDIVGTAEANATITVTIDGAVAGTAPADGSGNWTFTPTSPLAEGSHAVVARATDAAGNTSPNSNTVTFTIDTVDPAAPVITEPSNGDVLDDATPAIAGTAEANTTVTVYLDGADAGTAPVDASGNWTFTPAAPLAEGSHTVVATSTDAGGNTSPDSNTVTFTIDTVAPAAPVITDPSNGDVVADATPPIVGTAEAGSTVTVTIDGTVAGTAPVTGSGNWTFTPTTPLADGAHTVVATTTDAAGNTSPNSNTVTFTVDTVAPAAPIITDPSNGDVLSDNTPTITGTAEANSTVTVTIDGSVAGTAPTSPTGDWGFTAPTPLADGSHTVVATAADAAGNTSPNSNTVTFTIDTVVPAAPIITEPSNGDVLNDTTPTISGTAEPNSTVTVIIDGAPVGTTTAGGGGVWTFTPTIPLAEGPHLVTATATDGAGNTSPQAVPVLFLIDSIAPAAPVIQNPPSGSVLNNATPPISGTAEANTTVTVIIDGVAAGTTTANVGGNWVFTPAAPLADGAHTVVATATDAAGNTSPNSNTVAFTIDTVAPPAPVIETPPQGALTNDSTPDITGTAEPDSTVIVTIDSVPVGTTTADGSGHWSFTPSSPLADGSHTVTATARDAAGNTSPASAPVTFTVDTTPPAAPVITSPTDGQTVTDGTPEITGTAEPGSTVTVIIDGTPVGTATADENGAWTFTPTSPLDDGEHTITATATDEAGNTGPQAEPVTVTVDVPELPDVQLSVSPATQTVTSGSQAQLTVTVRNAGEGPATGVVARFEMPAGFTNYSGVAIDWPDGRPQPPDGVVGSLTFAVGDLAPGEAVVYRIVGTASGSVGSTLSITGAVTQNETDAAPASNAASAQIVIGSSAAGGGLPATGGTNVVGTLLPAGLLLLLGGLVLAVAARRRVS